MPDEVQAAYICPSCSSHLERRGGDHGIFWACPQCGGRAVGLGLVKRTLDPSLITQLWTMARSEGRGHDRTCPSCGRSMNEVTLPDEHLPALDVCTRCELVWFDPKKYEAFPLHPPPPAEPELPVEGRQILAIEQAKIVAERARREAAHEPPEEWWKFIAAIFGMPVKEDQEEMLDRPP